MPSRVGPADPGNLEAMEIELVQGDITEQHVDAIVNAANSSLLGGGGVDGAIHRAGGPEILAECRALRPPIRTAAVGSGRGHDRGPAPARWVIHTVGPTPPRTRTSRALLGPATPTSLTVAADRRARSWPSRRSPAASTAGRRTTPSAATST